MQNGLEIPHVLMGLQGTKKQPTIHEYFIGPRIAHAGTPPGRRSRTIARLANRSLRQPDVLVWNEGTISGALNCVNRRW
jgi:hypothetical protein